MIDALITLGYGAATAIAIWLASLSKRRVVDLACVVLLGDYVGANMVLIFQDFPGALWAWPVTNIACALAISRIRMIEDRSSLVAIGALYLFRAGVLDLGHAIGTEGRFAYVLQTNLVFLLQLGIGASEGADRVGEYLARLRRGLGVFPRAHPAMASQAGVPLPES